MLASQQAVRSIVEALPTAPALKKFTGGHTRVVWVTDAANKDSFAERKNLQLVGYDSRDGKGERIICAERANYYRPLITPDGRADCLQQQRKPSRIYRRSSGTGHLRSC